MRDIATSYHDGATLRRNVSADAPAPGGSDKDAARFSLRRLARAKPLPVLAIWFALCAWIGWTLSDRGVVANGDLNGLTPAEHRAAAETSLVLVWIDPAGPHTSEDLRVAVDRLHDHFGADWWPIAPPAAEVSGWLDAHALYLLPSDAHDKLVKRLGDESISASVESLRARLSSPLFGMTGQDARRDPLRLRQLAREAATDLAPARRGADLGADVTPAGDLISRDGTAVVLMLRRNVEVAALETEVQSTLGEGGIKSAVVGPRRTGAEAKRLVEESLPRMLAIAFAGIAVVLAVALRKLGPAVAILLCLISGVALVAAVVPLDAVALPLVVLLAGFGCEGALHLQRISERGWPAALVLGTAILALLLSPYPIWTAWSWIWLLAVFTVLAMLRIVLPAILAVLRSSTDWSARRLPAQADAACRGDRVCGRIGSRRVRGRAGGGPRRRPDRSGPAGPDPGADATRRGVLRPDLDRPRTHARRRPHRRADQRCPRRAGAGEFGPGRSHARGQPPAALSFPKTSCIGGGSRWRTWTSGAGSTSWARCSRTGDFAPAAFGEFLRAASDPGRAPSPGAALDGPLSRWVERYVEGEPPELALYSEVHLTPDPESVPPVLETQTRRLELFGPAVAARLDARSLRDWVGIYALSQLWICALLVWLGTRSLAISISAAMAALVTETATLALMIPAGIPLTPM